MEKPESKINYHQVARERAELRRAIKGPEMAEVLGDELEALNERAREFADLRDDDPKKARSILKEDEEAYKDYQRNSESWLDEEHISGELGPAYSLISDSEDKLSEVRDFEVRQLREGRGDQTVNDLNIKILKKVHLRKKSLESSLSTLKQSNPIESRAHSLISYLKGLHHEGHIAPVPSVKEDIDEIAVRMITGKPMFIHGPTGTGKTSLARYAAKHFTGKPPEMVYCNPQTREANIWGKQGIRPAENNPGAIETIDIFGPLARAMQEGKIVVFDEFTALPQEQMVFIKGILNAKIGDTVNIMGNGIIQIAPGFQMIFTANLKSEKNAERQELPPEIAREFEQNNLEVMYTPPQEAYDIMLARLLNPDGSIDLSYYDLNTTLPNLTRAMEEIQIGYTDRLPENAARMTGTLDASNKRPGLKKFVMTQGSVEAILESWRVHKQTASDQLSFMEFVDQRLKTALTFKEYPESDRILAAKILATKGFLRTLTPADLNLPTNVFDVDAAKSLREDPAAIKELIQKSSKIAHVPLKELASIDPFNRRQAKVSDQAIGFLPEEERNKKEAKSSPESQEKIKSFLLDTFQNFWSYNQEQLDVAKQNLNPEMISPDNIFWDHRKQDTDVTKSGEYTLNPETQNLKFENARVFIPDLRGLEGQSLSEIGKSLKQTYGSRYYIPGIEYWEYISKNPDKAPQELKDSANYYFYFGSILRYQNGSWCVPHSYWDGASFRRYARWLGRTWRSDCRVVLLER